MTTPTVDLSRFRRLEEDLWRNDPGHRERVLSDTFQEFCRFGHIYDRDHLIEAPSSGVTVDFPFDAFNVESLTDEVVLVTYENTVTNNGITQRSRRSSIWVLSPEGWKLRFQQATTLQD